MTLSGEHPDMSGNPVDAPLECHWCHKDVREDNAHGSEWDYVLLFCSEEWEEMIIPWEK